MKGYFSEGYLFTGFYGSDFFFIFDCNCATYGVRSREKENGQISKVDALAEVKT